MGSGPSKFGSKKGSKRNIQYPYPQPMFAGPYGPQQPYPPVYGNYQPMFAPPPPPHGYNPAQPPLMQPFIPPGAQYGQGQYLPQPLLNFLPQDKQPKRRSRRTNSDRFAGGFSGEAGDPQADTSRRTYSESHSRPFIPHPSPIDPNDHGPPTRTPTPFIPAFGRDDSETDEEEPEDRPRSATVTSHRASSRRTQARYPTPPPIVAEFSNVIQPLEPANRNVYGPEGARARTPLRNPLPPPPRDLYEMTPYRSLLSLPQTTALLTATYGPQNATLSTSALKAEPSIKSKKSGKGGLLRAFSRKEKQKAPEQPQVRFIPVFVPGNGDAPATSTNTQPQPRADTQSVSRQSITHQQRPLSAIPASPPDSGSSPDQPMAPVPPVPSSPPAIRFGQQGKYAVFMNHSPHRVMWQGLAYPTALHLHEALKFIDVRPDLAEKIRACESPEEVYPLSATFHQHQRPDWGQVFLDMMKQVLYQKFKQHPDLRTMLLSTGSARLIYVDADDTYWGSGLDGGGQNQLGQVLVDIRQRLNNDAPTAMYP
ncbi:hypothetical protein CPB83DRAFT_842706 [Crepidotus variabilis]|uniref:NADAR domain-containing protein n=1 Tax=Crepidotus variabilis TaxID=179855 RepID=A0A9P6JUT6_9AGAR|nr:hypothetical protein CPB83DRAFT_842706 [Crepidotus variabilis]